MSDTEKPRVELSVTIEASPDTVWGILSTPGRFSRWMEGEAEFEPRAGSPFRAAFPSFQTVISGEVARFDEEARAIALTWGVEEGPQAEAFPAGSSLVEFRVLEDPAGCRVELRHGGLPSDREAREHEHGWRFHASRLALFANRHDLEAALERTLAAWFSAWNEPDEAARLARLGECCAPDVEFRDDWAAAGGVERLGLHIGNYLKFVPGWRLEPTGDVRVCRGEVLFGWRGRGPGGEAMEGHNVARARRDGTLLRVTGFTKA